MDWLPQIPLSCVRLQRNRWLQQKNYHFSINFKACGTSFASGALFLVLSMSISDQFFIFNIQQQHYLPQQTEQQEHEKRVTFAQGDRTVLIWHSGGLEENDQCSARLRHEVVVDFQLGTHCSQRIAISVWPIESPLLWNFADMNFRLRWVLEFLKEPKNGNKFVIKIRFFTQNFLDRVHGFLGWGTPPPPPVHPSRLFSSETIYQISRKLPSGYFRTVSSNVRYIGGNLKKS